MAIQYKVLGQAALTASNTTVYTVPAGRQAVISTVNVCNTNTSNSTFRLAVRPAGETLAAKHYLHHDTSVPALDSINISLGITMGNTDVLTAETRLGNISMSVFGSEFY